MPEDTRSITHASLMLATTIHESNTTPHHQAGQQQHHPKPIGPTPPHHHPIPNGTKPACTRVAGLLSQSPIVCPVISCEPAFPDRHRMFAMCTRPPPTTGERPSNESSRSPNSHSRGRA
jgi:hypothetical protein